MANPFTQSVISGSGGDFTSLNAWEAQNLDLVSLDSSSLCLISGSWNDPETDQLIVLGWVTAPTCSMTIKAVGEARHSGKWSDTAYRLQTTANGNTLFLNNNTSPDIHLDGLQISHESVANNAYVGLLINPLGTLNVTASNCIVRKGSSNEGPIGISVSSSPSGGSALIYNCLVYGFQQNGSIGVRIYDANSYTILLNCTIFGCHTGSLGYTNTSRPTNCIFQNCGISYESSTGISSSFSKNNISNDSTAPGGILSITSSTVTFVDSASYDFHLSSSDSTARNNGADLYTSGTSSFYDDIEGIDRRLHGNWDIGASESPTLSVTQSIISGSGGDYTTLSSWEAQNSDLVSVDECRMALISGSWNTAESTQVTIGGWTTDASHSIWIITTGSARHSGIWNDNAYRIETSNTLAMSTNIGYLSLDGLQMRTYNPSANGRSCISTATLNGEMTIQNCIFVGASSSVYWSSPLYLYDADGLGKVTMNNCLIYGMQNVDPAYSMVYFRYDASSPSSSVNNCTLIGVSGSSGIRSTNSKTQLSNVLVQGTSNGFVDSGTFLNSTNNCSDIDGDAVGDNARSGSVLFVDSASFDFRLNQNDTVAKGYGADLSNIFTIDLAGNLRTVPWDIGALNFLASETGSAALIESVILSIYGTGTNAFIMPYYSPILNDMVVIR